MDKYYTFMLVPERNKNVVSFRVPIIIFKALAFLIVLFTIAIGILIYDYKQILGQVYENKHLSTINNKLRDQLNIFQMKINTISEDIKRIKIFEKKLRIITGIDHSILNLNDASEDFPGTFNKNDHIRPKKKEKFLSTNDKVHIYKKNLKTKIEDLKKPYSERSSVSSKEETKISEKKEFIQLKSLYHRQLVQDLGIPRDYIYNQAWSNLLKKSFVLAKNFAHFDFVYDDLKKTTETLETSIHLLDQFLLNQTSFMKSTPTILPSKGWITSYYGVRLSPYSGRKKMHEGLDIGGPRGAPILAPADGIITYAGHKPGFGKFIQLDHGYGVETIFGHCDKLESKYGESVSRGDLIARVGNTGLSTGPHLHYEVRINGVAVDPMYFILD